MSALRTRRRLEVQGLVQGVGLRAHVHRLAAAHHLTGFVRSRGALLDIEIQGLRDDAEAFTAALGGTLPGGARIDALAATIRPPGLERSFRILASDLDPAGAAIPPDWPMCDDCRREMLDPADRRFRYPFTHCAACGPRASVLLDLPYDRERTSMFRFAPCAACEREVLDPRDRRFHAQNVACPACGPCLELVPAPGGIAPFGRVRRGDDPVRAAAGLLARGAILAVKGYGGYHVIADARRSDTIERLRARKERPEEPLPVLVADLQAVAAVAEVGEHAGALTSAMRPIVVLRARAGAPLAAGVAPGLDEVGVMLPSTPMQVLLLAESRIPALVSTTADLAGWPVVTDDREAVERLGAVADAFLVHDRPIARRNHDPVLRPVAGRLRPLRLSRGSAPLSLPLASGPTVLAIGGDRKNAPALAGRGRVHLLPHVGDLDHPAAVDELIATVTHHARLLDLWPDAVAHDLDPGCASSRAARSLGLPAVAVQHAHAHFASGLVDAGLPGSALGLVLDGPGLGPDGTSWGGEILAGGAGEVRRLARLSLLSMPGGALAAAREPWRMAVAALEAALPGGDAVHELELAKRIGADEVERARRLANQGGPSAPRTSSCARLFDAVAALLGLVGTRADDGRGGVLLEALARRASPGASGNTDVEWSTTESPGRDADAGPTIPSAIVDTLPLIREVVASIRAGCDAGHTALAFHAGLADRLARATVRLARWTGISRVVVTGGCASNAILVESLRNRLDARGLVVSLAERVPATDAGLAVGQAAVAMARLATSSGQDVRGRSVR